MTKTGHGKMVRITTLFLALAFVFPSAAYALTVNADGTISCGPGKTVVFWEEDLGLSDAHRRILVLSYKNLEPREYLLQQPLLNRSMLLDDLTGGTNIPWRGLARREGGVFGTYRFLKMATESSSPYKGRSVRALVVSMTVYWPVCALTPVVEQWYQSAQQ